MRSLLAVLILGLSAFLPAAAFSADLEEQILFSVLGENRDPAEAFLVLEGGRAGALRVGEGIYTREQIKEGANIVIEGVKPELRVLVIRGDVDPEKGGALVMDFLVNGVTGLRDEMTVVLGREPDGSWRVYLPEGGRPVISLFMKNKLFLRKAVGIESITAELEPAAVLPERMLVTPGNGVSPKIEQDRGASKYVPTPGSPASETPGNGGAVAAG